MTRFFTFGSERDAEAFCTEGCPIYGVDLERNEVRDKGVTTRLADWVKHPEHDAWLVRFDERLDKEGIDVVEIDEKTIFPVTAAEQMLAVGKK